MVVKEILLKLYADHGMSDDDVKAARGHHGAVITHSPPMSEVFGSNTRPYLGKLVVAYR